MDEQCKLRTFLEKEEGKLRTTDHRPLTMQRERSASRQVDLATNQFGIGTRAIFRASILIPQIDLVPG